MKLLRKELGAPDTSSNDSDLRVGFHR